MHISNKGNLSTLNKKHKEDEDKKLQKCPMEEIEDSGNKETDLPSQCRQCFDWRQRQSKLFQIGNKKA